MCREFKQDMFVTTMIIPAMFLKCYKNVLNRKTLEYRRVHNSIISVYKIQHKIVSIDHNNLLPTRNLNVLTLQSRTHNHLNSFFLRAIRYWNSLPGNLQLSPRLNIFTERLATVNHSAELCFYFRLLHHTFIF